MISTNPLWPAALAAALTAAGLSAAAMGWQWTAQPLSSAWWMLAWPYTNVGLGFFWFLAWPAIMARRRFTGVRLASLATSALAAALGATAPLVLAAWLSLTPWPAILSTIYCQLCFALFALGLAVWINRGTDAVQAILVSLSVFLFLFLPLVAYLRADMLPGPGSVAWRDLIPWWDILQAAHGRLTPALEPLSLYAAIGVIATAAPFFRRPRSNSK
jgi:hypothetical protein